MRKISKLCPSYVQDMTKTELENLAVCLLRTTKEISVSMGALSIANSNLPP